MSSKGTASAKRPSTSDDFHRQEPETALLISPIQGPSPMKQEGDDYFAGTTDGSKERVDDGLDQGLRGQGGLGALPVSDRG